MIILKCRYCDRDSVFFRQISGKYLCKDHFLISIENKIQRTVRKYRMFTPQEKVVVGLSGGKDSLTVLYNCLKIQRHYSFAPPIEAILIDEGIQYYRPESTAIAQKMCEEWDVPLHIVSFRDHFGADLDEVIDNIRNLKINACTVCGTVRRRLLNETALALKADKLVIGHNLDDTAETFLQNILRNDLDKILSNPPSGNPLDPEGFFVPRIKPLLGIPESEIMLYCYYQEFPIQAIPCPYVENFDILRKKVLDFLNLMEIHSPEVKFNLLEMNETLLKRLNSLQNTKKTENEPVCKYCHNPMGTRRELCYYCELRLNLGLLDPSNELNQD